MATRDDILERIRKNTIHNYEMPDLRPLEEKALAFDDKISAFKKALEQAGGKLVSVTVEVRISTGQMWLWSMAVLAFARMVLCGSCKVSSSVPYISSQRHWSSCSIIMTLSIICMKHTNV